MFFRNHSLVMLSVLLNCWVTTQSSPYTQAAHNSSVNFKFTKTQPSESEPFCIPVDQFDSSSAFITFDGKSSDANFLEDSSNYTGSAYVWLQMLLPETAESPRNDERRQEYIRKNNLIIAIVTEDSVRKGGYLFQSLLDNSSASFFSSIKYRLFPSTAMKHETATFLLTEDTIQLRKCSLRILPALYCDGYLAAQSTHPLSRRPPIIVTNHPLPENQDELYVQPQIPPIYVSASMKPTYKFISSKSNQYATSEKSKYPQLDCVPVGQFDFDLPDINIVEKPVDDELSNDLSSIASRSYTWIQMLLPETLESPRDDKSRQRYIRDNYLIIAIVTENSARKGGCSIDSLIESSSQASFFVSVKYRLLPSATLKHDNLTVLLTIDGLRIRQCSLSTFPAAYCDGSMANLSDLPDYPPIIISNTAE